MPFTNTREEIGERATLDGLIDGTLIDLRDWETMTLSPSGGSYKNFLTQTLSLPNAKLSASYFFANSSSDPSASYRAKIKTAVLSAEYNAAYILYYMTALETADLAYVTLNASGTWAQLGALFFGYSSNLKTIIFRNTNYKVGLGNANVLTGTPFASGGSGGEVYVPQAFVAGYPTMTNWSAYNGYGTITWKSIEGSIYHHHYADGSPLPHTVTYNLTYFASSNMDTRTWYGDSYETTLTMDFGHSNPVVTVTMHESVCDPDTPHASGTGGGTWSTVTRDITSTAYDSETGVVSIPSITGNVTITATAT